MPSSPSVCRDSPASVGPQGPGLGSECPRFHFLHKYSVANEPSTQNCFEFFLLIFSLSMFAGSIGRYKLCVRKGYFHVMNTQCQATQVVLILLLALLVWQAIVVAFSLSPRWRLRIPRRSSDVRPGLVLLHIAMTMLRSLFAFGLMVASNQTKEIHWIDDMATAVSLTALAFVLVALIPTVVGLKTFLRPHPLPTPSTLSHDTALRGEVNAALEATVGFSAMAPPPKYEDAILRPPPETPADPAPPPYEDSRVDVPDREALFQES